MIWNFDTAELSSVYLGIVFYTNYGGWAISANLQPLTGYTNWADGVIVNNAEVACAHMLLADGQWHTNNCSTTYHYICQGNDIDRFQVAELRRLRSCVWLFYYHPGLTHVTWSVELSNWAWFIYNHNVWLLLAGVEDLSHLKPTLIYSCGAISQPVFGGLEVHVLPGSGFDEL